MRHCRRTGGYLRTVLPRRSDADCSWCCFRQDCSDSSGARVGGTRLSWREGQSVDDTPRRPSELPDRTRVRASRSCSRILHPVFVSCLKGSHCRPQMNSKLSIENAFSLSQIYMAPRAVEASAGFAEARQLYERQIISTRLPWGESVSRSLSIR